MSLVIAFASSKLGKNIIKILLKNNYKSNEIIALVRDEERIKEFKSSGIVIRKVDFNDYESLKEGLKGGEKLLLISSGDLEKREVQHSLIIDASKQLNYKYIVYTSFIRATEDGSSPIAYFENCHLLTEKWIKETSIPHTIIVNGSYTDVVVEKFYDDKVYSRGFYLPAGENSTINMATRYDMAEATVNLLLSKDLSQHYNQKYTFTTNVKTSYEDVARIFSEITGKQIKYINSNIEDYKKELLSLGHSNDYVKFKSSLALAIKAGEFSTTTSHLQKFLTRNPTTVKEFLIQYNNDNNNILKFN